MAKKTKGDHLLQDMVPLVADSVKQMRRCDVYRLLDCADFDDQAMLGAAISRQRPEFKSEVEESLCDLEADHHSFVPMEGGAFE